MRLYGKNPVIERVKSNPRSIKKIFIQEGHEDLDYLQGKARKSGIPVLVVPGSKIQKMARNLNTQGIVADVEDFPYTEFSEILDLGSQKGVCPLFLDEITDPQNLGGMIRAAACLGRFAIILPTHHSVSITETVLRVACGGENHIPVARVNNLSQAIAGAQAAGFTVAGALVGEGQDLLKTSLPFPLALVIGSEEKGIREVIRKKLDLALTIPMARHGLSMNVAHAATIFCYEIHRQRTQPRN